MGTRMKRASIGLSTEDFEKVQIVKEAYEQLLGRKVSWPEFLIHAAVLVAIALETAKAVKNRKTG